jgi:uncharacterized protein with beta-barrel porin domain
MGLSRIATGFESRPSCISSTREVLDVTRTSTITTSAAEVFGVACVSPSRDILTVGSGIAVRGGDLELYANYDVTVPVGNMIRHTVSAGLQYRF